MINKNYTNTNDVLARMFMFNIFNINIEFYFSLFLFVTNLFNCWIFRVIFHIKDKFINYVFVNRCGLIQRDKISN